MDVYTRAWDGDDEYEGVYRALAGRPNSGVPPVLTDDAGGRRTDGDRHCAFPGLAGSPPGFNTAASRSIDRNAKSGTSYPADGSVSGKGFGAHLYLIFD